MHGCAKALRVISVDVIKIRLLAEVEQGEAL